MDANKTVKFIFKETKHLQMWSLAIQYVNKQNVNANSNTFQILVGILSYDHNYFLAWKLFLCNVVNDKKWADCMLIKEIQEKCTQVRCKQ